MENRGKNLEEKGLIKMEIYIEYPQRKIPEERSTTFINRKTVEKIARETLFAEETPTEEDEAGGRENLQRTLMLPEAIGEFNPYPPSFKT